MNTLYYILEANLYLALFAAFYHFALRKEKNYLANRWVLITSMILAWTIPSLSFPTGISEILPVIELETITLSATGVAGQSTFDYSVLLQGAYLLGVVISSTLFIRNLVQVLFMVRKYPHKIDGGLRMIKTDDGNAWSFFNLIAIGKNIRKENRAWILAHEKVHVEELHSLDKILVHFVRIAGWFNPAAYYLEFALEENHEFRADEVVCSAFSDSTTYSQVLVSQSLGVNRAELFAHKFSKKSLLKSRIQMINQTKQTGKMKYLLTIPVLALALLMHSCEEKDSSDEIAPSESKVVKYDQNTPEGVYEVVEKMPEFKGGMDALITFMGENTIYPEEAKASETEGKVFVKFIIDESGKVTKPEVMHAISVENAALHTAALATISKMPDWIPGEQKGQKVKVQYVMPIQFALN